MANFTKQHIKASFIKLLEEMPFNEISVKMIVENCGINRKSFYYHYQDIPALFEEIIADSTQRIIEQCKGFSSMEECLNLVVQYVLDNKKIILHVYHSLRSDIYEKYLLKLCDNVVRRYIESLIDGRPVSPEDREIIVTLYRGECFGMIMQWLISGMKEDIAFSIHRVCVLRQGMINEVIERSLNNAV